MPQPEQGDITLADFKDLLFELYLAQREARSLRASMQTLTEDKPADS